ncbi:NAD(P)/FAD-dependent oxidoreductase [Actinoplanes sp. NPDC051470]|uniref:NAD(P)/FAD-dependent oxidoreductase n=1 Tax=Actinoplanes sp. NPDC051470 TaxID=3157224 RepID=UPI0034417814
MSEIFKRDPVDVVVVGGGLSGLGAALTLVRARRSVVVIDAGNPRNAPAAHSHGYLTRDGAPPLELLRLGREEIRGYGGEIVSGAVESVARAGERLFRVTTAEGDRYAGRRLLITTGLVDVFPDIPGLHERWGNDVVHCPFCFGWELRDQALGVLATGPQATMQALMWRQWSSDVTLFLHTAPEPTDEQRQQLAARGVRVVGGEVTRVEVEDNKITGVRLSHGEVVPRQAIIVGPQFQARHRLLDGLGVEVVDHPMGIGRQVKAEPSGFTGVPGVWVAGNVADVTAGVMQSAASGVTAAATLNADLTQEDVALAVESMRTAASAGL